MGVYLPLPSAYQEVEYIQSTATNPGADNSSGQYIDTLYTHNPNTKISIDIQFTTTAKQQRLFGVSTASSSYSTFAAYINGSTQRARATKDGDGNRQTTSVSADTNRHTFVLQNSNYVIYTNGATTYSGNNGNTMTKGGSHTLPLLCTWGDGDGKYLCHASAKLYSCKIWDNGTLVRDFVPCYRKSDTVIGLYDLVNNQFYTNSGTGTFSKGANVTAVPLKNAYIGEVWKLTTDFTQYTSLAQIQAQGWTGTTNIRNTPTYTYSSSGIGVKSSTANTYGGIYVKLPAKITNQNKITMEYTGSVGSSGSGVWASLCTNTTPNLATNNQTELSYQQSIQNTATTQGLSTSKSVNGTKTWNSWTSTRNVSGSTGIYSAKIVIDLPNSKAIWTCSSPSGMAYNSESSISSAGIECIVGTEYFMVWGVDYSSGLTSYIRSGSIVVEY